mmetsp:Transcript_6636/g.14528  ORF Transcript_6636/g.14528 Transcript_6636/m.14528 type:complete len:767 (+) Transcript_6636:73-2373(+)
MKRPGEKGEKNGEETWDVIVTSTEVVPTREAALERVSAPGGFPKGFVSRSLRKFILWHLPPIARTWLIIATLRTVSLLWQYRRNSYVTGSAAEMFQLVFAQDAAAALGLSSDKSLTWNVVGIVGRLVLLMFFLIAFRIYQRLSWRTTELMSFPNVKDDERYQDEELLKKAWEKASRQGWKDPASCTDYEQNLGGGTVIMQPRPGFCGIATLSSVLRSFGGRKSGHGAPYLSLHTNPRYVTLEEMVTLVNKIAGKPPDGESEWEQGGGSSVDSIQVIGGGPKGFASLEQFKAALRQLSHPTQPARIMAIYHRAPLFFCAEDRPLKAKLTSFGMVHWSPVLAYLEEEDLVLVMDVNHLYGPKGYLLPTQRFYDSVNTRDIFNGNYHGLILMRPPPPKGQLPLLTSPSELSVAFGKIKRAYYRHQAAGREVSAADVLDSDDNGYSPLQGNEEEEKSIRSVSVGDTTFDPVSAVVSAHPVFFANEMFIDSNRVPPIHSIRCIMDVFSKLRCVPRVAVRGFDSSKASKVHKILTCLGMVQIMKSAQVMFLNLETASINAKEARKNLPPGYRIEEIVRSDPTTEPSKAVEELGKLIVASYKFPHIVRRNRTASEFYSQTYQSFKHGGDLRHFACFERDSGEMTSCVALFCDRSEDAGARSDIAAIYNVCTSSNHRRKGLGVIMTLYALEEAKRMGCRQVILEASKEGRPLYERMGFVIMSEDAGGVYAMLSNATEDIKWKTLFCLLELFLRVKNGGLWYYLPNILRPRDRKG